MSENSKIERSHVQPREGCQKVGPGCDHCYPEARNARFAGGTAINWSPGTPRRRTPVRALTTRHRVLDGYGFGVSIGAPPIRHSLGGSPSAVF